MPTKHESLIELLRDVNRGIGRFIKDILADYDLPMTMMLATHQIARTPGITVSELARQTGIVKSHISNTIRDLEQRGWVEKKPDDDDQRILHLYLTPSAHEQLETIRSDIRCRLGILVSDIPDDRAIALIEGLNEIKEALNSMQNTSNHTASLN